MDAAPQCYRHPGRETWITCQRCGRPICPDCMVSASVGFQCPSCVKEGQGSVRQPRAPFGGALAGRSAIVTMTLIGINVAVWLAVTASGGSSGRLLGILELTPLGHCSIPGVGAYLGTCVAAHPGVQTPGVAQGALWQVVTSVFTHVAPVHLFMNMLALWFLGPALERIFGRVRFLAVYLVAGVCGSAAVMQFSTPYTATLGASGAIFGVMGALAVISLKMRAGLGQLGVWILLNLLITFTIPNISWQGHVGGLLGGAAAGAVIVYAPRNSRTLLQVAGLGAIAFGALAVISLRALNLAA